jgi:hypothetical protein
MPSWRASSGYRIQALAALPDRARGPGIPPPPQGGTRAGVALPGRCGVTGPVWRYRAGVALPGRCGVTGPKGRRNRKPHATTRWGRAQADTVGLGVSDGVEISCQFDLDGCVVEPDPVPSAE